MSSQQSTTMSNQQQTIMSNHQQTSTSYLPRWVQRRIPPDQSQRTTNIKLALLAVIAIVNATFNAFVLTFFDGGFLLQYFGLVVQGILFKVVWRWGNENSVTKWLEMGLGVRVEEEKEMVGEKVMIEEKEKEGGRYTDLV
ncbi:hypothetical protein EG328_008848 [Venturia inaequalis]|uniref:Uncharacterized protein n=1 Tax=Venturia inaequalis TaxID=5025 RepID=A0A8H3V714_VENIN|nr:hypothetical protein EG328_008848 [Venturia inaequalis]KAE9991389.1 hypothetical protein EG327_011766 [Venturia inaequalis]